MSFEDICDEDEKLTCLLGLSDACIRERQEAVLSFDPERRISSFEIAENGACKTPLTVEWVRDAKSRINQSRYWISGHPDSLDEVCNMMDITLVRVVLDAIAEERCEDPKACADIARDFLCSGGF